MAEYGTHATGNVEEPAKGTDFSIRVPDWQYVARLLNDLRWELQGFHTKIREIEALKYYEDEVPTSPQANPTGRSNVKIGLTDQLLETVKASMLANPPIVHVEPLRSHAKAQENATQREKYHQAKLEEMLGGDNNPNLIAELIESQLMGLGVLKTGEAIAKWGDPAERERQDGETADDHRDRVKAIKVKGSHPSGEVIVHPIATYCRPGVGSRVEEIIEHSYKSKRTIYEQYELWDRSMRGEGGTYINKTTAAVVKTLSGMPDQFIRTLPQGVNTTNYVLVTEYWNPKVYQVYVNGQKVHEEVGRPSVCYFLAPGRSSSSKDPDKYAVSIAENLRHNEPEINNSLSRMVEATDLIVNKRLTLEVPESYVPEVDVDDQEGTTRPRTWQFNSDYAEALPAGANIRDPYEGTHNVFAAAPVVNQLIQIASQHSVNPIMQGISPGAAGSGYRDNSLFMIAQSKYSYIIQSTQNCLSAFFEYQEDLIQYNIQQECWCGGVSLSPTDIAAWPAKIKVEFKPKLPQNLIAEGQFWEAMRSVGNVSRRYTREVGLNIENPDEMDKEVMLEKAQEQLVQFILQDVLGLVLGAGSQQPGSGLVGPDGQPIQSGAGAGPGGDNNSMATLLGMNGAGNGAGREIGRQMGGFSSGGQPKAPAMLPASTVNGAPRP